MASKSGQDATSVEQIEELLNTVDSTLDRLKTLYEQYFLGIQKQAPAFIHNDVERKLRDLTQINIRNTGLRYRLATLQQKFGSYNSYWRRTLRQIENGTYARNLAKIGREALRTGSEIPEEILAAMPKRMREQVLRDRDQALAIAKRREQIDDSALSLADDEPVQITDAPKRDVKTSTGAHVLSEEDGEIDFNAMFAAFDDDAPKTIERAKKASTMPPIARPQMPRMPTPASPSPSGAAATPPSGTATTSVRFAAQPPSSTPSTGTQRPGQPPSSTPSTGTQRPGQPPSSTPSTGIPRPVGQQPSSPTGAVPRVAAQTPSGPVHATGPVPIHVPPTATSAIPRPIGQQPSTPVPRAVGQQPSTPIPAPRVTPPAGIPRPQTGPSPIPRPAPGDASRPIPAPPIPAPPPRPQTGPSPMVTQPIPRPPAPSQQSRPIPVMPGAASQTGPVAVESMAGPFPREPATPKPTPPAMPKPTPQAMPKPTPPATPKPALKPPPGMTDADVNALHAKYVKAKEAIGEKVDAGSREKLLKTINQTAPKIMEQYKASGVDFSVVVKDNQVVIKAKPKT